MKAERRHELRENDLLHALEGARDYVNQNGARIAVALVAIIGIAAAVSFGIRSRTAEYEDIWRQKNELRFEDVPTGRQSLQTLAALTARTSDDAFVLSALMDQGRHALRLAELVPFPPDLDLNEQARQAFDELRTRFPGNPMAVGVAALGLATVEENLYIHDRDLTHKDSARRYLDSVVQNPALNGMPFQQMAIDRLASLDATFSEVVIVPPSAPPEEAATAPAAAEVDVVVDQPEPDGTP